MSTRVPEHVHDDMGEMIHVNRVRRCLANEMQPSASHNSGNEKKTQLALLDLCGTVAFIHLNISKLLSSNLASCIARVVL